jgi:predicted ATP-grasp superfamily ATP-dependent carboligase
MERWGRWKGAPDKPHFQLASWAHTHTQEEEEDIYKKLFDHFVELLEDDTISKEKIKDIPEEIREQAKHLNVKEVVVDYLETLDWNELFEEFIYMLVTMWKKK